VFEPSGYLVDLATRVAALLGDAAPVLLTDLPLAGDADRAGIERNVRAAAARFGKGTLGRPVAGDGTTTSSWAIEGERGALELTIKLETAGGEVAALGLVPSSKEPPPSD
jgi:hypothetical protein